MTDLELNLGKPTTGDNEKLLVWRLHAFRRLSGREPTLREVEKSRGEIAMARRS